MLSEVSGVKTIHLRSLPHHNLSASLFYFFFLSFFVFLSLDDSSPILLPLFIDIEHQRRRTHGKIVGSSLTIVVFLSATSQFASLYLSINRHQQLPLAMIQFFFLFTFSSHFQLVRPHGVAHFWPPLHHSFPYHASFL